MPESPSKKVAAKPVHVEKPEPAPPPEPTVTRLTIPPYVEGAELTAYVEAVSAWQKACWSGALAGSVLVVTWLGNTAQEGV